MSLSHLSSIGNSILSTDAVQYLNRIGIRTVEDLLFADPKTFLDQLKLSAESFSILLENIKQQYAPIPWNALDLYQHSFENTIILSTGCESIDNLLGGGIISGDLIELVGEPSSGKSQLCISSAVQTVASTSYSVIYIDTSNSFTTERAQEIFSYYFHKTHGTQLQSEEEYLEAYEKAKEDAFSRIYVHRIHDIFSLFSLLDTLNTCFVEKSAENMYKQLRLVVIDSLGVLLGSVLGGKGTTPQQSNFGMNMMTSVSRMMKHIASEYYIAFLFTNYTVRSDRDSRKKPGLGYSWSFVPPIQLYFSEENTVQGPMRVMTLTKSTRKAIGSQVYFDITEEGLVEIK